jgi:transposase
MGVYSFLTHSPMAYTISLSRKEQNELQKRKTNERDAKIMRRLLCIEMKHLGERNQKIAKLCNVCPDTITDWLCLYSEGGFERLCSLKYDGRRPPVLDTVRDTLEQGLKEGRYEKLADIQNELKEEHGIEICLSWIWTYCKKNSLVLTKRHG